MIKSTDTRPGEGGFGGPRRRPSRAHSDRFCRRGRHLLCRGRGPPPLPHCRRLIARHTSTSILDAGRGTQGWIPSPCFKSTTEDPRRPYPRGACFLFSWCISNGITPPFRSAQVRAYDDTA